MARANAKTNSPNCVIRDIEHKRVCILKYQIEFADTGLESEHFRGCSSYKFQMIPLFVNKRNVVDERRSIQIAFDAGFHRDKPLGKFYVETGTVSVLID
jgi:hypothetical protein